MKTKLDYYRVFYETALHSSFSTAAKKLYISQSAISQSIRLLEQDLDTQLFVRSRRGIRLTNEGEILFKKVESAISTIEQGETLLARLHHLDSGSLIIAAGDTITSHYLLPFLEEFHSKFPNIRLEMANSYSYHMLELIKEGKAELAFINLPVNDDELCIKPCFDIQDIFVCGPKFDVKEKYTWEQIAKEELILLEDNSSSRQYLDANFESKGIVLNPQIEIAAHDLLLRFASIHLGISCVVEEFSKESLEKGLVQKINLVPPMPPRSIGFAHLKDTPLSLPAKEFLKIIKNSKKDTK